MGSRYRTSKARKLTFFLSFFPSFAFVRGEIHVYELGTIYIYVSVDVADLVSSHLDISVGNERRLGLSITCCIVLYVLFCEFIRDVELIRGK